MKNCVLLFLATIVVSCGPKTIHKDGQPGKDGKDGYSLVVDVTNLVSSAGVNCTRTDVFQDLDRNNFYSEGDNYQNGFLVCDGQVGESADETFQITEIIDPCGPEHPSGFDEVILKVGEDKYLASFSDNANGKNTRFGLLPPGNYQTTDGTGCNFTL